MKSIISAIVFILFSHHIIAQNSKRFAKLYSKKKYEKVIQLSQKSISKNKDHADTWYYKSKCHLKLSASLNTLLDDSELKLGNQAYVEYKTKFTDPKSNALKREIINTNKRHLKTLPDSSEKRKEYVIFLAEKCGDTMPEFRYLIESLIEEQLRDTVDLSLLEIETIEKSGLFYKIPKQRPGGVLIVKKAEKAMNTPWKMGGIEPGKGFDCSGFVIWSYAQYGFELPHKTKLLAKIGEPITLEEAEEGDIVCFGSKDYSPQSTYHVGMVHSRKNENVKMIHCGTSKGVSIVDLTNGYWAGVKYFIVRIE